MGDLSRLVDTKMSENEVAVRKLLIKNASGAATGGADLRSLKERNLLEYVDTMVRAAKFELSGEMDEERARKNNRLDEVTRLVNTHRGLLDEHIRQQAESLKALLKANLNEEAANRHREDDKIIQIMNKRVEALERVFDSRLPEEHTKLTMVLEKNRLEFLDAKDDHDKMLKAVDQKQQAFEQQLQALEAKLLRPSSSVA